MMGGQCGPDFASSRPKRGNFRVFLERWWGRRVPGPAREARTVPPNGEVVEWDAKVGFRATCKAHGGAPCDVYPNQVASLILQTRESHSESRLIRA